MIIMPLSSGSIKTQSLYLDITNFGCPQVSPRWRNTLYNCIVCLHEVSIFSLSCCKICSERNAMKIGPKIYFIGEIDKVIRRIGCLRCKYGLLSFNC